jgi:hypothetical protein
MGPILASRTSAQWHNQLAALVGAFVGAVRAALQVLLADGSRLDPDTLHDPFNRATAVAFRPWTEGYGR